MPHANCAVNRRADPRQIASMRTTRINWHRGRCPSRSDPRPTVGWRWRDFRPDPADDWETDSIDDGYGGYWYSEEEREILGAFCGEFENRVPLPSGLKWKNGAGEPRNEAGVPAAVEPDLDEAWRMLTRPWESMAELRRVVHRVFAHPYFRTVTSMQWHSWDIAVVDFLARTERLWLRPLEAWNPPGGSRSSALLDLMRHLLVRFDLPGCLRVVWGPESTPNYVEEWGQLPGPEDFARRYGSLLCLVAAGRGWSMAKALRMAGRQLGLVVGDAAVRFLWSVPLNLDFSAAICWLHLRSVGVEAELATHIVKTFGTEFPPLTQSAAEFFQRNPAAVPRMQRIASWAHHMVLESRRSEGKPFSLSGRSARRVLEESDLYWRRYVAPHSSQAMAAREWGIRGWSWADPVPGSDWQVLELNTSQQLEEESREQRHCVASYVGHCATGLTTIVSVRKGIKRVLTVEIQVASKAVVQVRGFANRRPTAPEMELVRRWASAFGIAIQRA